MRPNLRSPTPAKVVQRRALAATASMWPPIEMHEYILSIASHLFYEHGLRAVGVDWVIREAGIAKATLYRHFPTKEALVLSYLQRRREMALGEIQQVAKDAGPAAEAKVDAIFSRLHRVAHKGFRGCAFVRAMAEHLESPAIHAAVRQHKDAVRDVFFNALEGTTTTRSARQNSAATLALLYDGALVTAMVQQQPDGVLLAKTAALKLINISPAQ